MCSLTLGKARVNLVFCTCDSNSGAQQPEEDIKASTNLRYLWFNQKKTLPTTTRHPLVEGPNQGAKQLDQEGTKTLSYNLWPKKPRIQQIQVVNYNGVGKMTNEAQKFKIQVVSRAKKKNETTSAQA